MRSMTGFGQAAGENGRFRMTVSLRAVNHRFLDLVLRGPEELRKREPGLRQRLSEGLARGRVELALEVTSLGPRQVSVGVDEELVQGLRGLCDQLADRGLISPDLALGDLLRLPELVKLEVRDPEWSDGDVELLERLVDEALAQLVAARETEGRKLRAALEERLEALGRLARELAALRPRTVEETARNLERRLSELLEDQVADEGRLAQEAALLADRSDVAEELDRLESHLDQMAAILGRDGSIGKRLDFLAQEIFRELNTLGAKCRNSEMTHLVVESKVLCEQIREQVHNVE